LGDGANNVQKSDRVGENRLLQMLAADDLARLHSHMTPFAMVRGKVLHEPALPIEHVYFPTKGMVSLLTVMSTGDQIETAIVGGEGVVGASIGIDGSQAATLAIVQVAGTAWRLPAHEFLEWYRASEQFRSVMNRFQHLLLLHAQQSAACHALHSVEARLCRWILQSQDMIETDNVPLTQEFLSHMLGVQRTSVSLCAQTLQKAGLIKYTRGEIRILNRAGLEDAACECYEAIRGFKEKASRPLQ
jgi:CRP-like cAMP-binding protein